MVPEDNKQPSTLYYQSNRASKMAWMDSCNRIITKGSRPMLAAATGDTATDNRDRRTIHEFIWSADRRKSPTFVSSGRGEEATVVVRCHCFGNTE